MTSLFLTPSTGVTYEQLHSQPLNISTEMCNSYQVFYLIYRVHNHFVESAHTHTHILRPHHMHLVHNVRSIATDGVALFVCLCACW